MNASRVRAVLESFRGGVDPGMTSDEQSELMSLGLLRTVDHGSKRSMERAVRELDSIANRTRRMTRSHDSARSRGIHWEGGSDARARKEGGTEELRTSLERLEELVRQKTLLDSLVFNSQTNSDLHLTLDGRRTIADLAAWEARFGDLSLAEFLGKMAGLRSHMASRVERASRTVRSFASPEPGLIVPEIRGPALMMAELDRDSERLAELIGRAPSYRGGDSVGDRYDPMLEATLLASSQGGSEAVLSRFKDTQRFLRDRALLSEDDGVKTLELMGLAPSDADSRLERMNWIRTNMVVPNSTDVAWLAGSGYQLDEVRARYDTIMEHLTASQFQEDSSLRSACAIMAGSSYSAEAVTQRFGILAAELTGLIESSKVAAAMLASGPLEPVEAIHAFKEAIGVVSRHSYFDDAKEIENLALLLTRRLSPDVLPVFSRDEGASVIVASTESDEDADRRYRRELPWHYWYYWTHRHYLHRTMYYIRTHPGHMHTVPYFG
jgi:hypothetical protein